MACTSFGWLKLNFLMENLMRKMDVVFNLSLTMSPSVQNVQVNYDVRKLSLVKSQAREPVPSKSINPKKP